MGIIQFKYLWGAVDQRVAVGGTTVGGVVAASANDRGGFSISQVNNQKWRI